jgi:hypothetical protein
MSSAATLRRTLLIALASLALCAPAAVARPAGPLSEAPTSSLSGTTDQSSAEASPGRVLRHAFDPWPDPMSRLNAAVAQERSYSTYGEPAPPSKAATIAGTDPGDGIAWLPFVLGLVGALVVGLCAGSGLQARRHATRPAI